MGAKKQRATRASAQKKVLRCGNGSITKLRNEIRDAGLLLCATQTETQLDTLLKTLHYLGDRGLNTPQAVGLGYARVATRVFDLEQRGWQIDTLREDVVTADGLRHRGVARYVLRGQRANPTDSPPPQSGVWRHLCQDLFQDTRTSAGTAAAGKGEYA